MSIDRAAIELRPLDAQSCTDLGFSLARQWYWSLLSLYLLVFLPFIALTIALAFLAPVYVDAVQLAMWWFKPLGEVGLLFWCSQALFGGCPSYRSAALSAYKTLPRLLLNYLGLFRLSPTRGLSMCVVFLEKTAIGKGRRRLDALRGSGAALSWVLVVGVHIELILSIGIYLILIYMIPFDTPLTEDFASGGDFDFIAFFDNNFYLLCAFAAEAAFAPFFVCASFVHYVNRRSRLEGWDIQHSFNSLNDRVVEEHTEPTSRSKAITAVIGALLACTLLLSFQPRAALADSEAESSELIHSILAQDQFGHYTEEGRLQLREQEQAEDSFDGFNFDFPWLRDLASFFSDQQFADIAYWISIALLLFFAFKIFMRFSPALLALASTLTMPRRASTGSQCADTTSQPANFEEARRLMLLGDTRKALSCLLRTLVDVAERRDGLRIRRSHTESECQQLIASNMDQTRQSAFSALIQLWRAQAYAGKDVPSMYADKVIQDCENAFVEKSQ